MYACDTFRRGDDHLAGRSAFLRTFLAVDFNEFLETIFGFWCLSRKFYFPFSVADHFWPGRDITIKFLLQIIETRLDKFNYDSMLFLFE